MKKQQLWSREPCQHRWPLTSSGMVKRSMFKGKSLALRRMISFRNIWGWRQEMMGGWRNSRWYLEGTKSTRVYLVQDALHLNHRVGMAWDYCPDLLQEASAAQVGPTKWATPGRAAWPQFTIPLLGPLASSDWCNGSGPGSSMGTSLGAVLATQPQACLGVQLPPC